jgi:ATP-binding cassette, subfamily C, bacterial
MRILWVFARTYPRRTAITMLCLLLAGLAEGLGVSTLLPLLRLMAPGASGPGSGNTALDHQVNAIFAAVGLQPTTTVLFAVVTGGILVKAALLLIANRQVGYTVANMATTMRLDLIRALLATRWEYYVHQPLGSVANSVALEAQSASDAYLRATTILAFMLQSLIYAVLACLVSWQAMIGALAGSAIIMLALNRLVRMSRRAGARQTRLSRSLLTRLTDTLQAVKPLKAMAREPLIAPVLEGETQRLNRALEREVFSKAALESMQEPLVFLFLIVALFGAVAFFDQPFANVIILVFLCARVLSGFGRVQKEFQRMVARESAFFALRDMIHAAEASAEVLPGGREPTLEREARFDHVCFAYEDDDILHDASLLIPAGELTVITGPSGAGKTTVVDLLIGLLQPQRGDVLIDGVALHDVDARRWREMIGYVPQETLMLHDSVAMNVTFGDPATSRENVLAALRAAGAWDFVAALPEGIDTIVGERGLRISGGQRQRLALARALVRRPKLLILDEATTALDPPTERSICETLRALRGDMTLVAICHHGRLIEVADHVWRVGNGRIEPSPAATMEPSRAAGA